MNAGGPYTKTCNECGAEVRRRSTYENDVQWRERKFCSTRCGLRAVGRSAIPERPCDLPAKTRANMEIDPCELASRELLKRLIKYGLKHDNDLAMGRDAFMARAREVGLAA